MNKKYLTLAIVAILIVGVIGFYIYSSYDSILEKEWKIEMNSLGVGSANWITPPNCNNQTYLSDSADYILTIKVTDILINPDGGKRDFYFEILSWEKGELNFVSDKMRISTDYDPQIMDDIPFGAFKENEAYKVYLREQNGKISFVDDLCGIKSLKTL
jgi:hypothetical protein